MALETHILSFINIKNQDSHIKNVYKSTLITSIHLMASETLMQLFKITMRLLSGIAKVLK